MFDASLAAAAARALHPILPPAAALGLADVEAAITAPPDPTLGDLAFPCFKLAKALRKAPPQIATELAAQITAAITAADSGDPTTILARAVAAGPYVNLHLDLGRAAALVLPALARGEVPAPPASGTRVMIEYSQPNTHKAFHVGHLRNLCLGDALVRLLRHDGDDVVAANYLGDVGAHIAKCLWWYLDHLRDRTPPPSDRGEWLGELYSAASNQLELWEEQAKAGDAAAATSLAAARARTTELLQKLEARDPELIAVWSETRAWSLADFAEIYAWCGVHFDRVFFESEVDEPGLKLVDEYVAKGIFVASEGAIGIFNEEVKHMPFFMLRKRDGTGLYATKDLALARLKFEEYRIDRSIYVVDVRQSDHFRHVFLTLKKMGFTQAERCQHVPYEMVELPDGPMATRKGNVVLFRSLRQQMTAHIRRAYLDQIASEWPEAEILDVAHKVALGAIKYGMLARDVNQKIVFDMPAWLELTGNTGPYLQYTCARAQSILGKCAEVDKTLDDAILAGEHGAVRRCWPGEGTAPDLELHPDERALLLALDRLPASAHAAAQQLRPSLLCTYLFELAQSFNTFNAHCPVKPSEGALLQRRLLLVTATLAAMRHALGLLGIPTPTRM
jgi:arginyl-tRNA synthetase